VLERGQIRAVGKRRLSYLVESVRDEILAFAKENLSPYKVPKIIEFMEELPLTPIGKVDKKALRKF